MAKLRRQIFLAEPNVVWTIDIPRGMRIPVVAELMGGGGGGGGNDSAAGGYGAAGQYLKYNFTVSAGDKLSFVIGGGGGAGASGQAGAAGGAAGTSVISFPSVLLDLRTVTTGAKNYAMSDGRWSSFMNSHAVWNSNTYSGSFDRTYEVTFPSTGNYQWQVQCDNTGYYYLDDVLVGTTSSFTGAAKNLTVHVTAGKHRVRVVGSNAGDVGGICLVITRNISGNTAEDFSGSLSGGRGGNAGTSGSSGGGGGGGGASALILNGTIIAIAGGGGGGGGAGNGPVGKTATNSPNTSSKFYNGQAGQPKRGDGGGGGASGGGIYAGAGGTENSGDSGGNAGQSAGCWGLPNEWTAPEIHYGSGVTPYIPAGVTDVSSYGKGGTNTQAGTGGYVRLSFDVSFASYKDGNVWRDVDNIYIKQDGVWKETEGYIKIKGEWQPLARREITKYNAGAGVVGTDYRDLAMVPEPVVYYSYYNWSTEGSSGGGGWESFGGGGGTTFGGLQGDDGFGFGDGSDGSGTAFA